MGRRADKKNLIEEWMKDKKNRHLSHKYVSNKEEFDRVDPNKTDYLLGLYRKRFLFHLFVTADRNSVYSCERFILCSLLY